MIDTPTSDERAVPELRREVRRCDAFTIPTIFGAPVVESDRRAYPLPANPTWITRDVRDKDEDSLSVDNLNRHEDD